MKSESLVIADQQRCGEYVPGMHTARHVTKVGNTRSRWLTRKGGGSRRRWGWRLGRSRNKVAVPEGAAGSTPSQGAHAPRHRRPCGGPWWSLVESSMKDHGRGPVLLSTARPSPFGGGWVWNVGVGSQGGLAHCWALRDQPVGWLLVASFGRPCAEGCAGGGWWVCCLRSA